MSVMRFGNPADLMAAIPEILPQLLVPTLIFHGDRDRAVPKLFAQRASALIPQAEFLPVDTGHFIPLSKPGLVAAEMRRFFGGTAAN